MVVSTCQAVFDVWTYIGAASALAISLIAFLYALGRILTKSELESLAKKELSEFFISFLIVIGVAGLSSIVCQVTPYVVKDVIGYGDQFSASYDYLNTLIYKKGIPAIQRVWTSSLILDSISSVESKFKVGKSSKLLEQAEVKVKPAAILKPLSKMLGIFTGIFQILIGSLQAQMVFIQLAEAFALTLILPIGMILRAVPGLRKGGSYLIAFAFGLYVVFPLMYVMNYSVYKIIEPGFDELVSVQVNPIETFKLSSDIINIFKYFDEFSLLFPQALVLPALNLTITIAFISSFATFLSEIK
ncbi:MAG: hypothetical protein QXW80_02215 [Candidatus Micrarchaeia archaeon]